MCEATKFWMTRSHIQHLIVLYWPPNHKESAWLVSWWMLHGKYWKDPLMVFILPWRVRFSNYQTEALILFWPSKLLNQLTQGNIISSEQLNRQTETQVLLSLGLYSLNHSLCLQWTANSDSSMSLDSLRSNKGLAEDFALPCKACWIILDTHILRPVSYQHDQIFAEKPTWLLLLLIVLTDFYKANFDIVIIFQELASTGLKQLKKLIIIVHHFIKC